jgi:PAS domain S-box-containing protein
VPPRTTSVRTGLVKRSRSRPQRTLQSFAAVIETLPDATVVVDADGRMRLVNRQTEMVFGYTRDALLGQPVERLLPERFHSVHRQHRAVYAATPRTRPMDTTLPLVGRRQDGSEFPVAISLAPLEAHGETLVIASIRAVSDTQQLQVANDELRRLLAVTDTALGHLELDDLMPEVLRRVHELMGVDNAAILLLDEAGRDVAGQSLRIAAVVGLEEPVARTVRVPVGEGFAGRIVARRAPLAVEDLRDFPVANSVLREHLRSVLGVPLVRHGAVLGVLHVGTAMPRHFTAHDVQLLERVAERVALAIETRQAWDAERQAYQAADTLRAQLQATFEAMPDLMLLYDAAGRLLRINPAMQAVLGIADPADFAAHSLAERGRPFTLRASTGESLTPDEYPIARALRGDLPTAAHPQELLLTDAAGHERAYSFTGGVVRDPAGTILGYVTVGHDVTERQRLEQERQAALEASEAWFRTLADTAPVLVWVSGTDGLVTFVNQPWLQFTGRTHEQEVGNGWAEGVHPDDYDHCLQTYQTAFQAREPFTMEYRLRRADGASRWVLDTGVPRYEPDGSFSGYIGSCIDISERHELEEVRASELALRELNARLDTFASIAAHDLRAPVGVSRMVVQRAQQLLQRASTTAEDAGREPQARAAAQAAQAVETTGQNLDRLWRLVQQLLDVSRVREGTLVLDRRPVDLVELVRSGVDEQRLLNPHRTIAFVLPDAAVLPVVVDADPERLSQVVSNYVSNAVRYSRESQPIVVTVQVVAQTAANESGRVARVAVRDQGSGITPEDQATIWERFQRASNADEMQGGLGLGLYIARTLIELHGGQVGVESVVGEGSTFWFTLPLAPAGDAG